MYKALYRAYRPEVFSQVLGQNHIVKILKHQIAHDETSHAYLFCGTRGTGKTTLARLLAKGVNCLSSPDDSEIPCGVCESCMAIKEGHFMDMVEIDAASNNGINDIRELRESVNYPPVVGRKKVYIIDEVHMLSTAAFNGLLKTLEEPPERVMFILATTEPEKLPATVLSRCMRLDFHRVSEKELSGRVLAIAKERGTEVEEDALRLIVSNGDGSVRDCLTILDQCLAMSEGRLTRADVLHVLGTVGIETYLKLTEAVRNHDPALGLMIINELIEEGKDSRQILQGWMSHYRDLLMTKFLKHPEDILNLSTENIERIREQSEVIDLAEINRAILEISKTVPVTRTSSQPRVLLEICMVKLATDSAGGEIVVQRRRRKPQKATESAASSLSDASRVEGNGEASGTANMKADMEEDAGYGREDNVDEDNIRGGADEDEDSTGDDMKEDVQAEATEDENLYGIWEAFLEDGERTMGGMFAMVRNSAEPLSMTDREFLVSVGGMTKMFMEKNILVMEDMLEKYIGERRELKLIDEEESKTEAKTENMAEVASRAEDVLGITVELK